MSDSDDNSGPSWSVSGSATCLDWHTDPNAIWPYCPSLGAAVLFSILYSVTTIAHLVQAIYHKKPFGWVVIMGGVWESVGFMIRAAATQYQQALYLYVPQQMLILLAPLWINAFMYMVLGRLVLYFLPEQEVLGIQARWFTLIFVLADICTFIVQAAGGSLLSDTNPDTVRLGQRIYMAGIGVQEACLLFYLSLVVLFHRRALQIPHARRPTDWCFLTFTLYAAIGLVAVRNIFRLAEFANFDSDASHMESLFYVFDALLIFSTMFLLNVCHPGRILVGPESEFKRKSRAEKREEKRAKKEAKQSRKIDGSAIHLIRQPEV